MRRLLAWLDRFLFEPRGPYGLGPMDVGRYEHPQRARDRIAQIVRLRDAELDRELTMLRIIHNSCTHKLLNG